MNIEELYRKIITLLAFEQRNIEKQKISETLIEFFLSKSLVQIHTNYNTIVNEDTIKKILVALEKLKEGYPLEYITNKKNFYGHEFFVDKNVLIPRPETEILVDLAIAFIKQNQKKNIKIFEVGTGTGCIPISIILEKNYPQKEIKIISSEISKKSIKTCLINTKTLLIDSKIRVRKSNIDVESSNIKFQIFHGNVFTLFNKTHDTKTNRQKFDLIISNPPYIEGKKKSLLPKNVRFEPQRALFGGKDGTYLICKIISLGQEKLNKKGMMLIEIGSNYSTLLRSKINKLIKKGFSFEILKDYSNKDRILKLVRL